HGPVAVPQRAPAHRVATHRPGDPRGAPHAARNPVPAQAGREAPTAVVRRREAPALVRHPGPAVGRPGPAAVRVGAPTGLDPRRPDVAHFGLVVPAAVVLEIGCVGRYFLGQIAAAAPPLALVVVVGIGLLAVPRGEIVETVAAEATSGLGPLAAPHQHHLAL